MSTTADAGPLAVFRRVEVLGLDELTPFPGNAKRGDVEAILSSLRRNAQYRSLIVREIDKGPLIVLAGNHTMAALELHGAGDCGQTVKVGKKTTPCGVCGNDANWSPVARCEVIVCGDAAARRINLADNRTSELGHYDHDALAELLEALHGDYEGTGYTEAAVARILDTELPDGFAEFDESVAGDLAAGAGSEPVSHTCPACGHTFTESR